MTIYEYTTLVTALAGQIQRAKTTWMPPQCVAVARQQIDLILQDHGEDVKT